MTEKKRYGIRVEMPANDPLSAAHLLGKEWASERWFATESERDRAMQGMQQQPPWYRKGDSPSVNVSKIER